MVSQWTYNRFGHIEISGDLNIYIQYDMDVEAFFDQLGLSVHDMEIDDHDVVPEWLESEYIGE